VLGEINGINQMKTDEKVQYCLLQSTYTRGQGFALAITVSPKHATNGVRPCSLSLLLKDRSHHVQAKPCAHVLMFLSSLCQPSSTGPRGFLSPSSSPHLLPLSTIRLQLRYCFLTGSSKKSRVQAIFGFGACMDYTCTLSSGECSWNYSSFC